MGWDVSERMVEALLAENVPGIDSKLKALLVFQHCTVHSLSLFDFLAKFRVDGLRVVPICDPPELMAAVYREPVDEVPELESAEIASDPVVKFLFSEWRTEPLATVRLEKLRLHMQEVANDSSTASSACGSYVEKLRSYEESLARVVGPVPTLGLLPDDAAAEVSDVAEESPGQEPEAAESETSSDPLPVVPVSTEAEQAEIAAVLANPKAAQPVSTETRKDASGRVLVSDAKLEQIYKLGERLAMNRVQVQEYLCSANKIRRIEDLPDVTADKIVKKMQDRIAAC